MPTHTTTQGLRPRHALCAHCAYHFNAAIPIIDNTLRCPECGQTTPLTFAPMAARRTTRSRYAVTIGFILAFTVAIVTVGLIVQRFGALPRPNTLPGVAVVAVAFVTTILLTRGLVSLRRFLIGRRPRP